MLINKKIAGLICAGFVITSQAFAQTPAVPAAAPKVLTPEKQAEEAHRAIVKADYDDMLGKLHMGAPRMGPGGSDANYDESKANPYPNLPDPLTLKNGKKVTTPSDWWNKRRPEIVEDMDREFYGRVPGNMPKVTWSVTSVTNDTVSNIAVVTKKMVGHVDNSSYPAINVDIDLTLTVPVNAKGPVPVIMILSPGGGSRSAGPPVAGAAVGSRPGRPAGAAGAVRPAGARPAGAGAGMRPAGGRPAGAKEQILQKGWGYASLGTGSIQPDEAASLTKGIIGLMNKGKYRKPDDWGVVRAWAWGASRALDYFETDKAVNAKQVGIEGHSRWGKATAVTMAYDSRFAIAYVSSSGEGGAKINRRNAGETIDAIADKSRYYWFAGNLLKYAGPLNAGDLPVDGHELIALCAPRPVFIGGGKGGENNGDGGDKWLDPTGMFMAASAAGPVYKLLGKKDLGTTVFPPIETMLNGDIAFRQHTGGHVDGPNWPFFLKYAEQYLK